MTVEYRIENSHAANILKSLFFTSFAKQNSVSNRKVASFTGKERDEETGLYYYGARYLDAKTSRWISTDPALGDYIPQAPINDEAKKHNQNLPGMGGIYNSINMHLYHYAGNNPVKYIDPDGKSSVVSLLVIATSCLLLKQSKQPLPQPVDAVAVNNSLANFRYNDGKTNVPVMRNPYTKENFRSLTLESNPIEALGAALPRGMYDTTDYDNENQMKGKGVQTVSSVLSAGSWLGNIIENLSEGHVGDVKFNYTKTNGKMTSWNISITTIDPVSGRTTKQILTKDQALKYLNNNESYLKNTEAYREISSLLD